MYRCEIFRLLILACTRTSHRFNSPKQGFLQQISCRHTNDNELVYSIDWMTCAYFLRLFSHVRFRIVILTITIVMGPSVHVVSHVCIPISLQQANLYKITVTDWVSGFYLFSYLAHMQCAYVCDMSLKQHLGVQPTPLLTDWATYWLTVQLIACWRFIWVHSQKGNTTTRNKNNNRALFSMFT